MKPILSLLLCLLFCCSSQFAVAERFIVKDGQPEAEIVIATGAPRTTRLAAQELQSTLKKITGAKLAIVTELSEKFPVKIYIGNSLHTAKLKITSEKLKSGAYRIVSGDNWLVLIGDDTDFVPVEPWPRSNSDWVSGRVQDEWHRRTQSTWGNPLSQMHKRYTGATSLFGKPNEQHLDKEGNVNVWSFDERGSFNAVCGYLRSLGVRWYMPGEVGEVIPRMKSLPLPKVDQTIHPDFPVRKLNIKLGVYGRDAARWAMRLGVRNPYGLQTAHGLHTMTHNTATLTAHPEWFALYGGKRHNQPGQRLNQLCYSNEELLQQTVRFVRAQFDIYKFDVVLVMPPDGYSAICQCELCKGKDKLDRGNRGVFSDYVWDFVNRVAKEVRKTHPDKMISNCAYGTYTLPPASIKKLEPNVQVIIVGGRRPTSDQPTQREALRKLRADWVAKTDNPILIFENYPFTSRGFYLPAFIPRVMGEGINATKGISRGEDIWLSLGFDEQAIGYNHFLMYFTARMYWGGKQQDIEAMFDEYCRLFYGPAADEMRVFFRYCEQNWRDMEKEKPKADRALELFAIAKAIPKKNSVFAKRIGLIDNYLNGLRNKREQLAQKRGLVPKLRLVGEPRGEIVIDGKFDEHAWTNCQIASTGRLRELQTGALPTYSTRFKTLWKGSNLYLAIRCEEHQGEKLNIATTRKEDQATWYGDVVEILLDTESHTYYQIAVNPSGAMIDLDRGATRNNWFRWDSKAEVATQIADDHWTIEIRIPIVQDENDPLHQVIGRKPTQSLPWHINICRQRIREQGSEYSAFSPTGTSGFHEIMKFAHFYAGRSHQFHADPTVSDYLTTNRAANMLLRNRKYNEAYAAYVALANGKVTNLQKSAALEQAAICARALKDYESAHKIVEQTPIDAVAKTVQMHNLLAERKSNLLLEQFSKEKINTWPFWKRGAGYYARGRAFQKTGAGKLAEADLLRALEFSNDSRTQLDVLLLLGNNREHNLQDMPAALKAYVQIAERKGNYGSATYYRGVLGAASILRRNGKFAESLALLGKIDVTKLKGYWNGAIRMELGKTLIAAGRKQEAKAMYRAVLADKNVSSASRKAAEVAIKTIKD